MIEHFPAKKLIRESFLNPDKKIEKGEIDTRATETKNYNNADKKVERDITERERKKMKEESGWTKDIVNHICSWEEYNIYRKADLVEAKIEDKSILIRTDIDWNQIDEKGRTNTERIKRGLAPLDKSGESIQLHHLGQHKDAPLAELTREEHMGVGNDAVLHDKLKDTEIHMEGNTWNEERQTYWKDRADYNEQAGEEEIK